MGHEEKQSGLKKCPLCAENIKQQAKICHFCGAEFEVSYKGYCKDCQKVVELTKQDTCTTCDGGNIIDRQLDSRLAAASSTGQPPAAVTQPAAAPTTAHKVAGDAKKFKEGIVMGYSAMLLYFLAVLAVVLLLVGSLICIAWGWDARTNPYPDNTFLLASSRTEFLAVPIAVPLLALLLVIFLPKDLAVPRLGFGTEIRIAKKHYKQEKKKMGFKMLLNKKGLLWKWIISMILWAALLAVSVYQYSVIKDTGLTIRPLFFILAICCAAGFIATLLIWPMSKKGEVVQIDRDGNIYKLGA